MKDKKLTLSEQRAVANVLTAFAFVEDETGFHSVWKNFYDAYELMEDPFTKLPCAPKDYYKHRLEYDRQVMIEMYGHCDGL